MNYDYSLGEPFLEITFPTRKVKTVLFKRENVRQVTEVVENDKPLVIVVVKSDLYGKLTEWHFDGTMEEFKKNCKTIYL